MIKELNKDYIEEINSLLSEFNYKLTDESFNNVFFRMLGYYDGGLKGIIIYDLLYDRVEIEYIIVDKSYRNRGIGTKLLCETEKYDIKNITLEVRESNITAINFYLANGFKVVATRKNYYGSENGYLMLKELGE